VRLALGLVAAGALSGCVSTQEKNERAKLVRNATARSVASESSSTATTTIATTSATW